jgi:hypothetical protein
MKLLSIRRRTPPERPAVRGDGKRQKNTSDCGRFLRLAEVEPAAIEALWTVQTYSQRIVSFRNEFGVRAFNACGASIPTGSGRFVERERLIAARGP